MSSSNTSSVRGSFKRTPPRRASSTDEVINQSISNLTGVDENSAVLVKYAFMVIGMLSIFKILSESLFYVYVLFLPGIYAYLAKTCPKESDFYSKEELKPIMDTTNLADNDPAKPKGYFDSFYAKAKASVAAEVSALAGMQEEYHSLGGAAILVTVTAPALGTKFYWVGALNKFHFIHSSKLDKDTTTATKKEE